MRPPNPCISSDVHSAEDPEVIMKQGCTTDHSPFHAWATVLNRGLSSGNRAFPPPSPQGLCFPLSVTFFFTYVIVQMT